MDDHRPGARRFDAGGYPQLVLTLFVSVRGDAIRVAPHVYNDASDVDRLLEILAAFV